MYKKILVGYDGTPPSRKAFDVALDLATRDGAEVHVLTVARTSDVASDVGTEAVTGEMLRHYRDLLAPLALLAREKHVAARFEAVIGRPAGQIMRYADENKADLIVVADRRRSALARFLAELGLRAGRAVRRSTRFGSALTEMGAR